MSPNSTLVPVNKFAIADRVHELKEKILQDRARERECVVLEYQDSHFRSVWSLKWPFRTRVPVTRDEAEKYIRTCEEMKYWPEFSYPLWSFRYENQYQLCVALESAVEQTSGTDILLSLEDLNSIFNKND